MRIFLAHRFMALGQKLTGLQGLIPELGREDEELLDAAKGLSMTALARDGSSFKQSAMSKIMGSW